MIVRAKVIMSLFVTHVDIQFKQDRKHLSMITFGPLFGMVEIHRQGKIIVLLMVRRNGLMEKYLLKLRIIL